MIRFRPGAALAAVLLCAFVLHAGQARAAAEIHRLSLVISGMPSSIQGDGFNDAIDRYNQTVLNPILYQPVDKVGFGWQFQGELRYFVRPNLSVNAGVSQLRSINRREFLPALNQAVNVQAELITVPVHLGASYYMQPYNQGDFSARMFVGGGMLQYVYTRSTFEQVLTRPDSAVAAELGGTQKIVLGQDGPGYFAEGGVQMWFANRYAVLLSVLYRSGELRQVREIGFYRGSSHENEASGEVFTNPATGEPFKMDVGGIGFRLGAVIQF